MTYPDAEVHRLIDTEMVPVQLSLVEPDTYVNEQARRYRLLWTPLLVWEDHRGIELRRSAGFLDVPLFLGQSALAQATAELLHARHRGAETQFLAAAERFAPTSAGDAIASEALFWAGVAALRDGRRDSFVDHWHTLKNRYPSSDWWTRASFIDHG